MEEEKELTHATLCYLIKGNKVLLAIKGRNIGKDRWNGYGGGIDSGEEPRESLIRELETETKGVIVLPKDLEKIAEVNFHNVKSDGRTFVCKVHCYLVKKWEGDPQETEEMLNPTWFEIDSLPFDKMMPADKKWLPIALSGKKIKAKPKLGPFQKTLLGDFEIEYVDSFDD